MIKENDLPDGWKIQQLKDVCLSKGEYGSGAHAVEYDSKKPRYIRITDIDENGCLKNKNIVAPSIIEEKYILEDGDLLFARSGSVGKTYLYNKNDGFCQYAGYLIKFKPNSEMIDSKYLHYLTKTPYYWNWINSKKNAVTIHNINAKKYAELKIPLPLLQTQKIIVAILEKAERLKEWRKESDELTDEFLKSTFLEMFGDPINNERNFDVGTIRDLTIKTQYGTSKKANEGGNGIPILRMGNITYSGNFDFSSLKHIEFDEDEKRKYLVNKGELLFNRTNSKELVGKSAVYRLNEPMAFAGYLIKLMTDSPATSEFIAGHLNSRYGKLYLQKIAKNIVGMANINAQEVQNIPIIIPPIESRQKFASIVKQVEQLRKHQSQSKQHIDDLFNVLMQKAFKGELI